MNISLKKFPIITVLRHQRCGIYVPCCRCSWLHHKNNLPPILLNRTIYLQSRIQHHLHLSPSLIIVLNKQHGQSSQNFHSTNPTNNNITHHRQFHSSVMCWDKEKPSSKVEETVNIIREEIQKKVDEVMSPAAPELPEEPVPKPPVTIEPKPSLLTRIKEEIVHYYHGFRLLFIDIKVSAKLISRVLSGKSLSRREYKQLVRTSSDVFRLVPFSVFIIVPFMELALPFFIKLFPGMLPSTFITSNEREQKLKSNLKMKLEMAKFLQQTMDEMAVHGKGHTSERAKEFVAFFDKVRSSGEKPSNEEILKFSKLFEDEITLDSLSRQQLGALCRVLEVNPIGTNNFLRFQLRMRLRNLIADDKIIQKEGLETLTITELQAACRQRGMRAFGMDENRLRSQLQQWLDLSLNEKVPPSLLLLSRALYLPDNISSAEQLQATISALPESVATVTKAAIGEREGKVEYKTRIEVIKAEEVKIQEERQEIKTLIKQKQEIQEQLMAKRVLEVKVLEGEEDKKMAAILEESPIKPVQEVILGVLKRSRTAKATVDSVEAILDSAPTLSDKVEILEEMVGVKTISTEKPDDTLTATDMREIEDALVNIGAEKKQLLIEKEELSELKAEMADYQEDIHDLQEVIKSAGDTRLEVKESKAARRLFKKVNTMIKNMDKVVGDLMTKGEVIKEKIKHDDQEGTEIKKDEQQLVSVQELIQSLQKLQKVPDKTRLEKIADALEKMDIDKDGNIPLDDVLKVIDMIGKENVNLTSKQMADIIDVLTKEDKCIKEQKPAEDVKLATPDKST